jgi:microcin C transport system substrate-binding protein
MSENLFDPFSSTVGGLFWMDPDLYDQTLSAMKQGTALVPVTLIDERFKVTKESP